MAVKKAGVTEQLGVKRPLRVLFEPLVGTSDELMVTPLNLFNTEFVGAKV